MSKRDVSIKCVYASPERMMKKDITDKKEEIYPFLHASDGLSEENMMEEEKRMAPEVIRFEELSYRYESDTENIIDHKQLELQKGKVYQLIGESGSGKTTLLKLILGLYHSDTAKIYQDDRRVASIRSQIGYVPANPSLFNASIYDNIAMGQDISRERCMELADELGIKEWITSLPEGLDHMIDKNAENVSGGQKQAIAVLRALVHDHPVLILDEPFSALDQQRAGKLSELMQKYCRKKIVLLTTHRDLMQGSGTVNITL